MSPDTDKKPEPNVLPIFQEIFDLYIPRAEPS